MAARTRFCGSILRAQSFLKSARTAKTMAIQMQLRTKAAHNKENVRRVVKLWPYWGSAFGGLGLGWLGYHFLCKHLKPTEFERVCNHFLPDVLAKSLDSESGVSPPSKRFNFIADAVEMSAPAVVRIEVTDRRMSGYYLMGHTGPSSLGSGFIVSEDGMVLTNAHVVENALEVNVKLKDGRQYSGEVVDIDPVKDLAAIRLRPVTPGQEMKFPTLKLGTSSTLRPGEWVIAMGSPLMLSNTVTSGIVSTVHRGGGELGLPNRDMEYIQTDAAINVGNSGGPLVNLDGEVIGISVITIKFAAGISFAIPIDAAKEFLQGVKDRRQMRGITQEKITPRQRWYIGINMLTLTSPILGELQRRDSRFESITRGVFVAEVNFGSPAQRSGLKSGDVITKINNQQISTSKEVYEFVRQGETLNLEVQRGGHTAHITVKPQLVG